jgi:dTMP kinase
MEKNRGKLIVIDGGDGSGKTVQAKLLLEYLQKKGIPTKYMDFPRYQTFYGKLVAQFLRGEFGSIDQVSPYLASLTYALDRAHAKEEMHDFLEKGGYIVANRYATSNMAHQGTKFTNLTEREKFLQWEYELEYIQQGIPKEDIVIYLYVPWKIGIELTEKKGAQSHLNGKKDIHEQDTDHRKAVENMYLELTKKYDHWVKIDCTHDSHLLSPEEIHEKVVTVLHTKI